MDRLCEPPLVRVDGLHHSYGDTPALRGVSFDVRNGEILGLLGPNGSGKTTALRAIAGLLRPTAGSTRVRGHTLVDADPDSRSAVGYLSETNPLYETLDVWRHFDFIAALRGIPGPDRRTCFRNLVAACDLAAVVDRPVRELSKGYRQRLGLALALMSDPPVLLLDEPATALDPRQRKALWALIRDLKRGRAILLSTHILPEANDVCDRLVLLDRGLRIAEGTPAALKKTAIEGGQVRVRLKAPTGDAVGAMKTLGGISSVSILSEPSLTELEAALDFETDPRPALQRLFHERGWTLLEMEMARHPLEEIFFRLTRSDAT